MRVLFIIAPWSYETVYPGASGVRRALRALIGTAGGPSEPLGLLYLAAYLRKRGHEAAFLDGAHVTGPDIVARALELKPDLVGFSCITHNWPSTRDMAGHIRRALPGAQIVLGGPHATCWQEDVLKECDLFDAAVIGEGEETLAEYMEHLEGKREVDMIDGLIWRRSGRDGVFDVVKNSERKPIVDLDSLPFPEYSLIDIHRYRPSIGFYNKLPSANIITTRGCPQACAFCISRGRTTKRSIDSVIGEMAHMVKSFGIRHFTLYDESFTLVRDRVTSFCSALRDSGLGVSWCANVRADEVDGELLKTMKSAGCWKLLYGIESGVMKNLERLGKSIPLDVTRKAIEETAKAGIETFGCFIFGIPGETFEEGMKTIDFALSLPLDYAAFLNLVPYKGTRIYRELEEQGESYGTLTGAWSTNRISFIPSTLTRAEMEELNTLATKRFYRRPGYLLRRLLAMRTLEDLRRNLIGLVNFIGVDGSRVSY